MRELPKGIIIKDFFMWFDFKEKEEHYLTPLYLYNVSSKQINPKDDTRLCLKLEKDISKVKINKKKEIYFVPSAMISHYVESIGSFLINFLNADFTTYESAYNTFFYAYGYELIRDYAPPMYGRVDGYIDDVEFRKIIKETFEYSSYRLMQWQDNFKKCVDFVYNLNGNEELKDKDVLSKKCIVTNWDQGEMSEEELFSFVKKIMTGHELIGVDICGECAIDQEGCDLGIEIEKNDSFNLNILKVILC